jgi:hypothetical protein
MEWFLLLAVQAEEQVLLMEALAAAVEFRILEHQAAPIMLTAEQIPLEAREFAAVVDLLMLAVLGLQAEAAAILLEDLEMVAQEV